MSNSKAEAKEQKAGAQIGKKAFIQSLTILLALMVAAGVLTLVVPAGQYARMTPLKKGGLSRLMRVW